MGIRVNRRIFLNAIGAGTGVGYVAPSEVLAALREGGSAESAAPPSKAKFIIAVLTPVDRAGRFDGGLARDLLAYLRENGVDGAVVLGTTGEFSSFSVAERKVILEVMTRGRGSLDLICHVGASNLPDTIELLNHAADSGADAALVLPPFYFKKPSVEGLEAFFMRVLDAARIPVLLYNIPQASGVAIPPKLVTRLSEHELLQGLKDSSGNAETLLGYLTDFPKLRVYAGSMRLIKMTLENGGAGTISGNGVILTKETAAIFERFHAGQDMTAAQERLNQASKLISGDIPSLKFALGLVGLRETYCRPPLMELTTEQKADMHRRFAELCNLRETAVTG